MTTMTTTAPFGVTPFHNMFNDFARVDPFFQDLKFDNLTNTWSPLVTHHHWDLVETTANYRFHCDLPGVRMEDIDIAVQDNVLKVTGMLLYCFFTIMTSKQLTNSMISSS